ncbi:MAG: chitobiase/beta-hexosaminidase C-terminal domain-containing protein, partial [Verrucomicrobiota bacterium]
NGTLQVKGFKNGFVDSQTVSNNFNLTVANPVILPTGATTNNAVNVTLTSLTSGAQLYWTIDSTDPSPTNGILYTNTFALGTNGTLQVKGFKNGFIDSQSVSNTFNLVVATPVISPGSGTNINSVQLIFSSASTNSTYHFTSDGTEPTVDSPRYSGSLTLVTNTQLRVVGLRDGFVKSATAFGDYFIQVDKPTMSPGTGFFPNGTTVTLTVTRADAKIYYTLNGQDPTPNDQLYTGPFILNQVANQGSDLRVVKARAFAPNTLPSDIVSGQAVDTNSIGIPRDVFAGVGATVVVPLVINLQTNQVLRSLQFRFEVSPNSASTPNITSDLRALAITGNDFVQVVGPSQGSSPAQLNASAYRSGGTNGLVVSAIGTNANFVIRDFGTVALLALTIPPTANVGDSYTIQVVQASGTSDGQQAPVRLAPMGSRTVTVKNISYVVGDSALGTWYNAGDFGDGNLDNSDVNNSFYASLGIRVPYAFTDVFDAMDAFPDDTNGSVGGDGQIRFLDWQRILSRSLRRDTNNWRRSWAGGGFRVGNTVTLNGLPNTPSQTLSSLPNGIAWLRQALLGAPSLENVDPNGTVDVPVYVDVKPGYSLTGLQFRIAVESDGPSLEQPAQFISAPGLPRPISVDGLPANQVVCAWPLVPSPSFNPALQSSNLLGHVRFTIPATARPSQCYNVHFLTLDGSPDDNTQYDLESLPGCVWVQSGALKLPDRISDEWKTNFFGSLSNTLAEADADPDGDGVPNLQEFLAGTSPAKLLLHIADISSNAASGTGFKLRWFAALGKRYVLECSPDVAGTNWRVIADNLAGQGDIKEFIETNRTSAVQFYRVRVKP